MKATFDNTVSILVKAYLNDTLIHGDCAACAVGNLIASSKGYKTYRAGCTVVWQQGYAQPHWQSVFLTDSVSQSIQPKNYTGKAKDQIDSTGYTWQELARIEKAFESAPRISYDDRMFNGLMAVIDVLAEIHNIDLTQKETAKALFVK